MLSVDLTRRGTLGRAEYLYREIRDAIVAGELAPDEKLPSKRKLAEMLGCSLITVESALTQLAAEGYIEARPRRGYYVERLGKLPEATAEKMPVPAEAALRKERLRIDTSRLPARPDRSALLLWEKSLRHVLSAEDLDEAFASLTPQGLPRLQRAIAAHLAATRGMKVEPDQIVVAAGAQVLYQLVAELVVPGALCAVEDPGFPRIAKTYEAEGKQVLPVMLDREGISVAGIRDRDVQLVHVMPSHQFPTGRVMSIARRYELLGWAAEAQGRLIVEDDYDCEFRLAGHPIPALASIDATGAVIYIGTFSKSLGPVVRAAYAVLPPAVARRYEELRSFAAGTLGTIDQLALATMLEDGSYESHVARYRRLVKERRDHLVEALVQSLGEGIELEEADSGLHMVLALPLASAWQVREKEAEETLVRVARDAGIGLAALSSYAQLPYQGEGRARFVLQYERLGDEEADEFAESLGALVRRTGLIA